MFELLPTSTFVKQIRKLETSTQKRIEAKLTTAAQNPRLYFEGLTGAPLFKLRVGDYRVIAKISFAEKKVFLLSVSHRKKVYERGF